MVGRYEIVGELGRGGMGRVHLAREVNLDRDVALKEMGGLVDSREATARFLREARLAGSLSHPNIVTVFEYFELEAVAYIAMEFVPGGSLRPYLAGLDLAGFAGVMEGVLAGLGHAQTAGVVHRDLKPENVLVTAEGAVKIGDFGLAKATQAAGAGSFATGAGVIVGTPRYMAPEQILGGEVGVWSDLYSVGVMAYEQIVGRLPFDEADAPATILMRHVNEGIPSALDVRAGVDPGISRWLDRLLVKDPAARIRDPVQAWEQLEEIVLGLLGARWRRSSRVRVAAPDAAVRRSPVASVQTILTGSPLVVAGGPRSATGLESGVSAERGSMEADRLSRALPDGEVTLLFSEIEDSARLLHDVGDIYGDVLAAYRRLVRGVWSEHGGVEVSAEGDSFLVAFAYAAQAVTAAGEAQRAVIEAEGELHGVRVRIGVHTGAPHIRDGSYWGTDVHYAARLCAAANGGQVLLSATTHSLVADVEVEDLGEHALKDFPAARGIFHLLVNGRRSDQFPPIRGLRTGETNLPDQISSFIGREAELAALRELVSDNRIVSLVGAGGVGKTRLALRLGAELLDGSGDGVWFVDLAPITDAELVGTTIATVLQVPERPGEPILDTLSRALAERQLLIVIDNCEHVIDAAAHLVAEVVGRCPRLSVIATSREPLRLAGEHVYRVPSLSTPSPGSEDPDVVARCESVQLFVDRARQQRHEFSLTAENANVVGRICQRLDGIPLAIELAAVRLRSLSVADLDTRLDRRFGLLKTGARAALPRQQTLRALIDWSYQLLSPAEQEVLALLSVFAANGFDVTAAEAVCARLRIEPEDVLDHLDALVDKSLIQADENAGRIRYRLLETIRDYALQKLTERGGARVEMTRRAHRDHYLSITEGAHERLRGRERETVLDLLEIEHDNLRLALTYCLEDHDPRPGLRLGNSLYVFWRYRGHAAEGSRTLSQHLARPDAQAPTRERGYALVGRGRLLGDMLCDYRAAQAHHQEALRIGHLELDDRLQGEALLGVSWTQYNQGDYGRSIELNDQATKLARSIGDGWLLMACTFARGAALAHLGQDPRPCFQAALELARQHGNRSYEGVALADLGATDLLDGDVAAARVHFEQAHHLFQEVKDPWECAWASNNLGFVCYAEGDRSRGAQWFAESLAAADRFGGAPS